jgi:hypothetical protein
LAKLRERIYWIGELLRRADSDLARPYVDDLDLFNRYSAAVPDAPPAEPRRLVTVESPFHSKGVASGRRRLLDHPGCFDDDVDGAFRCPGGQR